MTHCPIFHNEYPKACAAEIINLYSVVDVIDLTAGAGAWAKAAMDAGVPYCGVALTLKHQEELSNHLAEYVKKAQSKEEESPDKENDGPDGDIDRILRTAKKTRALAASPSHHRFVLLLVELPRDVCHSL